MKIPQFLDKKDNLRDFYILVIVTLWLWGKHSCLSCRRPGFNSPPDQIFFYLNTKEPFVKIYFSTETKILKRWSEMCRFTPRPILSKEIKKLKKMPVCMP